MKRQVKVVKMTLGEYMQENKVRYDEGSLFDYPVSELDYIITDTDIQEVALIGDRLYEIE